MPHVLIVEDDPGLAGLLKRMLADLSCRVTLADSLDEAHDCLGAKRFDLVILDRGLPDGDGLQLLKQLSQLGSVVCLILSAEHQVMERIKGLRAGAAEYIGKPFSREEMMLRIKNLLCRTGHSADYVCDLAGLQFWPSTGKLLLKDEQWQLSRRETQLLHTLVKHRGHTLTKSQIIQQIWQLQVDQPNDETIEVYIRRLRRRLPVGYQHLIHTVKGFGYRLEVQESAKSG